MHVILLLRSFRLSVPVSVPSSHTRPPPGSTSRQSATMMGALAAAGATADANLLASFDVQRDPFQHKRKAGSVPHLQSLERYSARGEPARWRLLQSALDDCARGLLRLKLGIL